MRRQFRTLGKLLHRLGFLFTLLFIVDSLLTRFTRARILLIILRDREQILSESVGLPSGFSAAVRTPEEMRNVGGFCGTQLSEDFLRDAVSRGDRCVVILHDNEVVNFQWVSEGLTLAYDDIWIGFGPGHLYGYNSLTTPSYRGRSLNRCGVQIAGQSLAVPEGKGLAGYINATNVASILSHWNPAAQDLSVVLVWPRGEKQLRVFASPGCRAGQLTVVRR